MNILFRNKSAEYNNNDFCFSFDFNYNFETLKLRSLSQIKYKAVSLNPAKNIVMLTESFNIMSEATKKDDANFRISTIDPLELEEHELMQYKEKKVTWTQILGGSVGNILEWYDFAGSSFTILHQTAYISIISLT